MDLRQLEYAVAVADHGGFTRAAAASLVAQPSLSQGVRSLERELGVALFERIGRGVQITSAGQLVVDAARRVLRDLADLAVVAAAAGAAEVGRLDVVALPTLAVDPLAGLVGALRLRHPGITVHIREPEEAADVDQFVRSGRAELGLTDIATGGAGLVRVPMFRQALMVVCPPGWPLADDALTPAALAAMPLVVTPAGTSTRRILERALARVDAAPNVVVEISQREAILPLVLAGAGAALLPAPMAAEAAGRGAVVRTLRPPVSRRVGVLHRTGPLSPAARAMISIATEANRPT